MKRNQSFSCVLYISSSDRLNSINCTHTHAHTGADNHLSESDAILLEVLLHACVTLTEGVRDSNTHIL